MDTITIGQVYNFLMAAAAFISALAGASAIIIKIIKKQLNEAIKPTLDAALEPIHEDIKKINNRTELMEKNIQELGIEECKNFLVRFIEDVNAGETIGETEIERYYEVRDRYYSLGGNSYIHTACEAIEKKLKK